MPPRDPIERELPWRRIGWVVFFGMVVLGVAANAIMRDVGNKSAIERVRKAEEYATHGGPAPVPEKLAKPAQDTKPFSAEEAEREMAERERIAREKVENDLARKDDENRRKMERTNREYERERWREEAELRRRQNSRIP